MSIVTSRNVVVVVAVTFYVNSNTSDNVDNNEQVDNNELVDAAATELATQLKIDAVVVVLETNHMSPHCLPSRLSSNFSSSCPDSTFFSFPLPSLVLTPLAPSMTTS